jgi:hypothetical protein
MSPASGRRSYRQAGLALAAALILIPSALLAGELGAWQGYALGLVAIGMVLAILVG